MNAMAKGPANNSYSGPGEKMTPKQAKRARKKANKKLGNRPKPQRVSTGLGAAGWHGLIRLKNNGRVIGAGTKRARERIRKLFGKDFDRIYDDDYEVRPLKERVND